MKIRFCRGSVRKTLAAPREAARHVGPADQVRVKDEGRNRGQDQGTQPYGVIAPIERLRMRRQWQRIEVNLPDREQGSDTEQQRRIARGALQRVAAQMRETRQLSELVDARLREHERP